MVVVVVVALAMWTDVAAQNGEAATEKAEADEKTAGSHAPQEVFTTTHYIGLELEEGMCYSMSISAPVTHTDQMKQVPSPWICHIKLTNLRHCVHNGRNTRTSSNRSFPLASNTCESKQTL